MLAPNQWRKKCLNKKMSNLFIMVAFIILFTIRELYKYFFFNRKTLSRHQNHILLDHQGANGSEQMLMSKVGKFKTSFSLR